MDTAKKRAILDMLNKEATLTKLATCGEAGHYCKTCKKYNDAKMCDCGETCDCPEHMEKEAKDRTERPKGAPKDWKPPKSDKRDDRDKYEGPLTAPKDPKPGKNQRFYWEGGKRHRNPDWVKPAPKRKRWYDVLKKESSDRKAAVRDMLHKYAQLPSTTPQQKRRIQQNWRESDEAGKDSMREEFAKYRTAQSDAQRVANKTDEAAKTSRTEAGTYGGIGGASLGLLLTVLMKNPKWYDYIVNAGIGGVGGVAAGMGGAQALAGAGTAAQSAAARAEADRLAEAINV